MREHAVTILVGIEGERMGAISIAPEGAMSLAKKLFGDLAERDDPRQDRSVRLLIADAAADGFAKGRGGAGARRGLASLPSGEQAPWVEEELSEAGLQGAERALAEMAGSAWVRAKRFDYWDPKGAEEFGKIAWAKPKAIALHSRR